MGRQIHWDGAVRRPWAVAPVRTQVVDPTEADPWVPSEVVGVAAAVVAEMFVVAVVVSVVVVGTGAVAAAAVAVVAAAAVAAPQGSASYVGAYDPEGIDHF